MPGTGLGRAGAASAAAGSAASAARRDTSGKRASPSGFRSSSWFLPIGTGPCPRAGARTNGPLLSTRTCAAGKRRQPCLAPARLKIDAAIALMMAVGRAIAEDAGEDDLEDFLRNPVIA